MSAIMGRGSAGSAPGGAFAIRLAYGRGDGMNIAWKLRGAEVTP